LSASVGQKARKDDDLTIASFLALCSGCYWASVGLLILDDPAQRSPPDSLRALLEASRTGVQLSVRQGQSALPSHLPSPLLHLTTLEMIDEEARADIYSGFLLLTALQFHLARRS
jgi:hypothetical protein